MENLTVLKEKVRQSVDLVNVVSDHVSLRRRGKGFWGRCPFHSEKTASFQVNPEMGIFKCFGCGAGGDVFKFVQLIENVDFMDALRALADRAGIDFTRPTGSKSGGPSRADLGRVNAWAAEHFRRLLRESPQAEVAHNFLSRKGLTPDTADDFGLGLAPAGGSNLIAAARKASIPPDALQAVGLLAKGDNGDTYEVFRERLMFPIRDAMKRVIGFGGRTLGDARAKYVNTSANQLFDKGRNLYGLDKARKAIADGRKVVVVEGYTDCLAAHQHGFTETVATLGTAMTEAHASLLRRYCDDVVLVFDSDAAGEAAADRALSVVLPYGLRGSLARVPEGKDPCDYLQLAGADGFKRLLKSAEDALGFKWKRTLNRFQSEDGATDRRAAMMDYVQFVAEMGRYGGLDAVQRGLIVNELARVLSVPAEDVQRLMARSASSRPVRPRPASGGPREQISASWEREPAIDAEQAALITILECLLNEPSLWPQAEPVLDPQRFRDLSVREVVKWVRRAADAEGTVAFSAVLSSLETPAESALATDLLVRGQRRGEFSATFASAMERLAEVEETRRIRSAVAELARGSSAGDGGKEVRAAEERGDAEGAASEDEVLRLVGQTCARLAGRPQFAPRRAAEEYGVEPGGTGSNE